MEVAVDENNASSPSSTTRRPLTKHKRRYCRQPGCTRIVKSQGLCQRHGAKPRKCKWADCDKQAQGNFDGMCKSHFKQMKRSTAPLPAVPDPEEQVHADPPPPTGESVYDSILPASIAWNASDSNGEPMPLIQHLKDGFDSSKPTAWHRNEERRARGLWPVHNPAQQLEGWERELVWMEILVLTGNPETSFRHLARGWGRDKGFHMVLAQFICERHGNVERKKRERGVRKAGTAAAKRKKDDGEDSSSNTEPDYVGGGIWDHSCYGDAAMNEALAAELVDFGPDLDKSSREFSFETGLGVEDGQQDNAESSSSDNAESETLEDAEEKKTDDDATNDAAAAIYAEKAAAV